jgi:hypothetical protein
MSSDIDLDFADRTQLLSLIEVMSARQITQGKVRKHTSGIYPTDIPYDPINQCAAIDYETAANRGYFKIDLLNVSVYQLIKSQQHYDNLLAKDPPWSRLWSDPEWAKQVIHIGNYTDLLSKMKPDTVPRMAAFIAIIRPGKSHLQNCSWSEVFQSVWDGDSSKGFIFKKSHSISYATLVALHMNILSEISQASDAQEL